MPSRKAAKERPRAGWPLAIAFASVVFVAACAQFFPHRPVPVAAALAILLSWALTRAPLTDLGIRWPERPVRLLLVALALAVAMNAFGRIFLWPTIYRIFGTRDLSYLGPIRGNLDVLIALMPLIWLSAAICEEIVYRGFLQQRLERIFGNGTPGNVGAVVLTSAVFAANHAVQGTSGMIQTFIVALAFGAIFIASRHNLVLLILMHGFWDTFSTTVIYLDWHW